MANTATSSAPVQEGSGSVAHSRRRVVIGGLGALATGLAALVGRSSPASAADGDAMLLGESNTASTRTFLDATGTSGLIGIQCNVTGTGSLGLMGGTAGGIGVQGSDYGDNPPGVGLGVYASSTVGDGAKAQGGRNGIWGIGGTGPGVLAENAGTGPALQVEGTALFSRSGVATVKAGDKSVTVGVEGLSASSLVLATPQRHEDSVSVSAAIPNRTESTITIFLSKPASASLPVAWFVVN